MATLLLLPGAGGEASYWDAALPFLEAAGHDVVAPDLPADDESAGLDRYADVAIDALAAADRAQPLVVVAQSLGSFTAAVVCERVDVALLIFVGAMIPEPGETAGDWWGNTGQGAAMRECAVADGRDPDAPWDEVAIFFHDLPPERQQYFAANGGRDQTGRAFADKFDATCWKGIPMRVLAGRDDRIFPLEFMRRLSRDRLGIEPDVIESGHLPGYSRPEELAYRILAYVDESAAQ
jgi:pimeloyl-ACP methyl ester carboxylesterase